MTAVVVVLPVLSRPHRVQPLLESLKESKKKVSLEPLFVVSGDDHEELEEVKASGASYLITDWLPGHADFAKKTNYGIASARGADWFLAGADDLVFQYGWADIAIEVSRSSGCRFVGTNDRANPMVMSGAHATHPLVHRSYVELGTIDEPGKLYCEQYSHQAVDNEACATAKYRNEFVFAQMSVVEHHHPFYPINGVKVPMDSTYEKALKDGKADIELFHSREHLWDDGRGQRRLNGRARRPLQ